MTDMARLRWLCRRGMKELDVVMSRYLEHHYPTAPGHEQAQFEALLEMADPDLYSLLLGRSEASDPQLAAFVRRLRTTSGGE